MSFKNRFTREWPCPVCKGWPSAPDGQRCTGALSADELYYHCSRADKAGGILPSKAAHPTYAHRVNGSCKCGFTHGGVDLSALQAASASASAQGPRTPIVPVPNDAPSPSFKYVGKPPAIAKWPYRDASGALICYRVRYPIPDSTKKEVLPYTFCDLGDGTRKWKFKDLPSGQRPLYGLDILAARPDAPVLVGEGEKTADAMRKLVPTHVGITWAGGAGNGHHVDWSPLAGRDVVFWPDADLPTEKHPAGVGIEAARQGAQLALAAGARSVRIVDVPTGPGGDLLPDGWDLADLDDESKTPAWMTLEVAEEAIALAPDWDPPAANLSPMGDDEVPAPDNQLPADVAPIGADDDVPPSDLTDGDLAAALERTGARVKMMRNKAKKLLGAIKSAETSQEVKDLKQQLAALNEEKYPLERAYKAFKEERQIRLFGLVLEGSIYDIDPQYGVIKGEFPPGETLAPKDLDQALIASKPFWPAAIAKDLATGEDWMELAWTNTHGNIVKAWRSFGLVTDTEQLGQLARLGAPVPKLRLAKITGWLADAWNFVVDEHKRGRVTSRLGWVQDGEERRFILPGAADVVFTGEAWEARGTMEAWAAGLPILLALGAGGYLALAVIGLCAASPLARLVGKRNPILGLTYPSSRGKTTVAKYALAMWGDPDRLIVSADLSTTKGVQTNSLRYNDLCMCLDELQRKIQGDDRKGLAAVADMVYVFGNGLERITSSRQGEARGGARRWGSAIYASETPLLDVLPTGAQFRAIELDDLPLPDAETADTLQAIAMANVGAMANALAEQIRGIAGDASTMANALAAELRDEHPDLKGDDPFTIALVALGLGLVAAALGGDLPIEEVKGWLAARAAGKRRSTPDQADLAFKTLLSSVNNGTWVEGADLQGAGSYLEMNDLYVAWVHGDGTMSINPQHPVVKSALANLGGDRHAATWVNRGWLKRPTRGTQSSVRNPKGRMVAAWRVSTLGLAHYKGHYSEEEYEQAV